MARTRRRDSIRAQGRANAALMLLARDMGAEFVEPADEQEYAVVRGRTEGCTFELHVDGAAPDTDADAAPALALDVRHFHAHRKCEIGGAGCELPGLEPDAMRAVIESTCRHFAESAG